MKSKALQSSVVVCRASLYWQLFDAYSGDLLRKVTEQQNSSACDFARRFFATSTCLDLSNSASTQHEARQHQLQQATCFSRCCTCSAKRCSQNFDML
eukprot:5040440-Amphidinium_carterae.1